MHPPLDPPPAPWLGPESLPPNPLADAWGVLWDGEVHPMGFEALRASLASDPPASLEEKAPNPVILVARPGEPRVRPAAECPEFAEAILGRDLPRLTRARNRNGLGFGLLAILTLGLLGLGLGRSSFLPALYAALTGSAYLELHLAVRKATLDPAAYLRDLAQAQRYAHWQALAGHRGRTLTYGMVGTWVALGALQLLLTLDAPAARGLEPAALIKPLVATEPWRLLTGTLLHGSLMHLMMNASGMLALGFEVERTCNRALLPAVWLVGALAGSLASWWLLPAPSVGASGGLMALLGFLAVMGRRRRELLPPDFGRSLLRSIGIMALFGVLAWGVIDNAAHGGGLLAGVLLGLVVFRRPRGPLPLPDTPRLRAAGLLATALFGVLALATATLLVRG